MFVEDLDAFLDDYGIPAKVISPTGGFIRQFNGIFDDEFLFPDSDTRVEPGGTQPEFICKRSESKGLEVEDKLQIDGENFNVQDIRNGPGPGFSTLILE